jgi:hypothetical protein
VTVERKIVVGIGDIKAITLACKKCGARVSFLPDKPIEIPHICPQCRSEWRREIKPESQYVEGAAVRFLEALLVLRTLVRNGEDAFSILFEFEEPKPL